MLRYRYTESGDLILGRVPAPSGDKVAGRLPLPPSPPPAPANPQPAAAQLSQLAKTAAATAEQLARKLGAATLPAALRTTLAAVLPPPAEPPTRVPAVTTEGAAADSWFFVSKLAEFPGNFPPVEQLRAVGITGVALEADDPLLAWGAGHAHELNFKVMVWAEIGNYNNNPQTYIAALQTAQQTAGADAVGLDVETEAKGVPGSAAYKLSAQVAELAQHAFGSTPWAVLPIRSGSDFNFAAYTDAGGTVIIQTYGSDPLRDLFDPVEVVQLAVANGVPANRISVLLSPVQATADNLVRLKAIGITSVSLYRQDGMEVAVANAAGFPSSPSAVAATVPPLGPTETAAAQAAVAAATETAGVATVGADVEAPLDAATENLTVEVDGDDPPDELGDTTASLAPLLFAALGDRSLQATRRLAAAPHRTGPTPPAAVLDAVDSLINDPALPRRLRLAVRAAWLVWAKGIPYVWGGTDPNRGLDCSGFAQYVLRIAGVSNIARVTYDQAKQGRAVSAGHRQVLDLCFFEPSSRGPGHVAVYMARSWAIHEPHHNLTAEFLNVDTHWRPLYTHRYLPDLAPGRGGVTTRTPPPTVTRPRPGRPVKAEQAWAQLRHRIAVVWPQVGRNARQRADSLHSAVD